MGIKQGLTRLLLGWLPVDDQARMAADLINWLYADLPSAERQDKVERLAPRLLERIRQGRIGLRLLIYYHLLRLPPLRWLDLGVSPAHTSTRSQSPRSVSGRSQGLSCGESPS